MTPLEPGVEFEVSYGNGHVISVVALNGRQKCRIFEIIEEIQELRTDTASKSVSTLYRLAEEAVKICVPNITEQQIEAMNENQQMEIAAKTLTYAACSEDQIKKSE